jgi:hypothetical protein
LRSANPQAAEIIETIVEFERSVEAAEIPLAAREWHEVDALLTTQHRLTHALANLLEATRDARPEAFTAEVNRRIGGISERRAEQLRRLMAFNHLVKQRLIMISRVREMRRVNVESQPQPRILDSKQ